jgi:NAD(P)H-quinone oxidoreductase subunit 5
MIDWASAGNFHLKMGYPINRFSALMSVIVTTVALFW